MCTDMPMILGTGTRAVYTMSLPTSCDKELDSLVFSTRASKCGRAMSHMPCALMYAVPSSKTFGVSMYMPFTTRTYPSDSRVSNNRRVVGRASLVAAATSLTESAKCERENALMTFSPRARASTKSGSFGFGLMQVSPPQLWHKQLVQQERPVFHGIN